MKSIKAIFLFLIMSYQIYALDPLLVVVIMVKDEAAVIRSTLEMYCKADPEGKYIAYLVYDTGDDCLSPTMIKAQELFEEYNLTHYFILQEPFVDFSTSRNRALNLVEEKFPHAVFALMPDAEWYLHNVEGLLAYCIKEQYNTEFGPYFIRIKENILDFQVPRLFRPKLHSRFKGVVHEAVTVYAEQIPYTRLPEDIFFEYHPSSYGQEKSKARLTRDRTLLLNQYHKDPTDMHATFYLAQTYEFLLDWENAYKYYTIRAGQNGWIEDNFLAAYKRAFCAEQLVRQNTFFSWETVHALYLQAYSMRPTRIEPLIRLASYYLEVEKNMALGFLYARYALDVPYPSQDTNFVEKDMYEYQRYYIVSVAAWYLGFYDIGQWATHKAIEARPAFTELYKNLQYYTNRAK